MTIADFTDATPPTERAGAIDYDSAPGLRWTHLSRMRRSPLHYRNYVQPRTAALSLGTALHALMSGESRVCAYPGPVRRGKEWEKFRDEHRGDIIVTKRELEVVEKMGGALVKHPEASAILDRVTSREVVVQWDRAGRACKAKIDGVGRDLLVELKSTRDVSDRGFGKQCAQLGYIHQAAWYHSGWMATRTEQHPSRPEHVIVAVENVSPFDVRVAEVEHELIDMADREIERLLARLDECERSGVWPGLAPQRGRLGDILPDWWLDDSRFSGITLDGEVVEI